MGDPRPLERRQKAAKLLGLQPEMDKEQPPPLSFLWATRTIGPGELDRVKKSMASQRDRYTKRVEWRLENASRLQAEYTPSRSIQSPTFAMAGLEDLQLICAPNASNDGFCSLLVSAPASFC